MSKVMANKLDAFRRDINQMEQGIRELEQLSKKVFDETDALTAMWSGPAHDVYMAQFANDRDNMNNLLNALNVHHKEMQEAYRKYASCEQQVREVVDSIQV